MTPNLGTRGNGEPVVQPTERSRVCVGHRAFRIRGKPPDFLVALWAVLALSACTSTPSQSVFIAQPQTLPYVGGQVQLNWNIEGASLYTLRSEPPLPGLPLHTTQPHAHIQVEGHTNPKSYRLILEASSSKGIHRLIAYLQVDGQLACSARVGSQARPPLVRSEILEVGLGHFDVPHVAGRLIAYHKNGLGLQSNTASAQSLGAQWVQDLGGGWNLYRAPPGREAIVAKHLYQQGLSQYVQPEYLYQPNNLPLPPNNRSYQLEQVALFGQMNFEQAWQQLDDGCDKPVIAVADTGVYTQRGDLAPNLTPPNSWLDVVGSDLGNPRPIQGIVEPHPRTGASHGTQVASIIAATTNDGSELAGTAYNLVRVLPIKVFDAEQRAGTLQVAQALEYAAGATKVAGQVYTNPTPAQVVNLSLSMPKPGFRDPYLEQVLEQVTQQGLIVVASSGNTGLASVGYPASSPFVIAVGATDASKQRAQWFSGFASNYGPELEFVAPGTGVPVAHGPTKGDYALAYGTSAAAPFVSSTVGLYLLQRQRLGIPYTRNRGEFLAQVRKCLQSAAQNGTAWNSQTGFGLIDVAKVVDPNNPICFPQENP